MQIAHKWMGRLPKESAGTYVVCRRMLVFACVFLLMWGVSRSQTGAVKGHAADVNPFIGTGRGPGPFVNSNYENLFPGAAMPFGMVQLSPDTENNGFGYHYDQHTIQGFSMTHMSGAGCPNEGEVFMTPTTGTAPEEVKDFESPYAHDQEAAHPGYYRVHLDRWNVDVELTATDRTGEARFTFPAGQTPNLLVPISHTLNHTMASSITVVGNNRVEGYVVNQVFCRRTSTYKVYFVITFDRPFATFGTWTSDRGVHRGSRQDTQISDAQQLGAYVSWAAADKSQSVTAHLAISYVDLAGAANNLSTEAGGKDFAQIHRQATKAWDETLGSIEVSGGTDRDRRVFYTALYHSLLMPSILSDADGRYLGFDDSVHRLEPGHNLYGNFSGWDIYRSQMPLVAMIEPHRMEDMAQSIVLMYQQGGWIGRWPQINKYTNVMLGSPLSTILAMAWLDGLHGFDVQNAWQGMLVDATQASPAGKPYQGRDGIDWINRLHFAPNDKVKSGSVSQILEDGMADVSLYRLALALGKQDDARQLYDRALYYRNVFNANNQFLQPRNADEQWVEPFDPEQANHGFREGSGWHYQWAPTWDMNWLLHSVGHDLFNQRLDALFSYTKPDWTGKYYNPYNETDLATPFAYNFSGEPWKAQRAVRRVLSENYPDAPDGVPGNDDCGEMSSWAVMSMMGIYPADPTSLNYELVSPSFAKIVIHLHAPYSGKTFTIETTPHPDSTPYINRVNLNGHNYSRDWVSFRDISSGGTLRYVLAAAPNSTWATAPDDAPPSLSDHRP